MPFPTHRPRRLRRNENWRRMVRETHLRVDDFVSGRDNDHYYQFDRGIYHYYQQFDSDVYQCDSWGCGRTAPSRVSGHDRVGRV